MNAMQIVSKAASINIHHPISILYAYCCSQLFIAYQARGNAIKNASRIGFKKFADNNFIMLADEAPNTLRTPISLVRCSAVNVANPNNPRQEIKMARNAKMFASLLTTASLAYNFAYSRSEN